MPDSTLKSWLIIFAPAASIGLAALCRRIGLFFESRTRKKHLRKLNRVLNSTVQETLCDPDISEAAKLQVIKDHAAMKLQEIDAMRTAIQQLQKFD